MRNKDSACFMDTNIWLYAFILGQDANKTVTANRLIHEASPVISTQVINEVCVNLVKKAQFEETQIRNLIDAFYEKYPVVEIACFILSDASRLRERYSLSFWDGLIVASALSAGVAALYSEDMQHGLRIDDRLKIVNPFKLH